MSTAQVSWLVDVDSDEADLSDPEAIAKVAYDKIRDSQMGPVLEVTVDGRTVEIDLDEVWDR